MYLRLIDEITANDRIGLAARGVPSTRVSEWRTTHRLPTRAQALALAEVKGVDPVALEKELVLIETEREAAKKPTVQRMLERLKMNPQWAALATSLKS